MYKDVLRAIADIDIFPVVSLILFVTMFTIAVVWALYLDRASVETLAALPLDDSETRDRRDPPARPRIEGDSRGA